MKRQEWIKGKGGYAKKILLDKIPGKIDLIHINVFPPKVYIPPHYHTKASEIFYILEGGGILKVGRKKVKLKPGLTYFNKAGTIHEYTNGPKTTKAIVFKINTKKSLTKWVK